MQHTKKQHTVRYKHMVFQRANDNSFPDETAAATNGNAEKLQCFPISNMFLKHNS